MIVSCPTCSTHYSHAAETLLVMGRCSKCDATFPLSDRKRRYVVMPAVPAGGTDPLLTAGVAGQTQLDLPPEAPPTDAPTETFMGDAAPLTGPLPSEPDDEDDGFFGAGMDDDEALFGIDDDRPEARRPAPAKDSAAAEPRKARPAHPIREAFGVFLLAALGGAAGFHGSMQFGFEPLNAVAVGLGVGLTLGWAWIRWAERKR